MTNDRQYLNHRFDLTRAATAADTGDLNAYSESQQQRGLDDLWSDIKPTPRTDRLADDMYGDSAEQLVQGGQGHEPSTGSAYMLGGVTIVGMGFLAAVAMWLGW